MPDMSEPNAHLNDLLTTLEYLQEEHFREAAKHNIMGNTYQECAHRLKRAIEADREKPR